MNVWERELNELIRPIASRFELRPGITGPILYCSTCAREISDDLPLALAEIVKEAEKHEEINHDGHQSTERSSQNVGTVTKLA